MNNSEYKNAARRNLVLAASVIVITVIVVFTAAYARYEMSFEGSELKMEVAVGSVYIYEDSEFTSLSSWRYDEATGEYSVDAVISNASDAETFCKENQNVSLEIFVSLGIVSPENINITLMADNEEYTAIPTAVEKNSPIHISNGDGWIYKFYNAAGEELSWTLIGGEVSERNINVKISGNTVEPALIRFILSGNIF